MNTRCKPISTPQFPKAEKGNQRGNLKPTLDLVASPTKSERALSRISHSQNGNDWRV
jgi:hypothetical protein